jgi:hypothetical protein
MISTGRRGDPSAAFPLRSIGSQSTTRAVALEDLAKVELHLNELRLLSPETKQVLEDTGVGVESIEVTRLVESN